jgi:hypothetical protein
VRPMRLFAAVIAKDGRSTGFEHFVHPPTAFPASTLPVQYVRDQINYESGVDCDHDVTH